MGVMSCYKRDCENIMCDCYVPSIGYICYECQNQFEDYLKSQNKTNLTEGEIVQELEKFMELSKNHTGSSVINIREFFDRYQ